MFYRKWLKRSIVLCKQPIEVMTMSVPRLWGMETILMQK